MPRQIDLRNVAGDYRGRSKTDSGQKHFHLLAGSILGFIEDDKSIIQRPAAHKRQRRHLDNTSLNQAGDTFKTQHFI